MVRSTSRKQVPSVGPDSVDPETGTTAGGVRSTHSRLALTLAEHSFGSRAMLAAIGRASSFVRTLACCASARPTHAKKFTVVTIKRISGGRFKTCPPRRAEFIFSGPAIIGAVHHSLGCWRLSTVP
jgi:hypothetical protein